MDDGQPDQASGPQIVVTQGPTAWNEVMEYWSIGWVVENRGIDPLTILSVRLPHGQFKCGEQRLNPSIDLDAGRQAQFHTTVQCSEPPGLVTENAFVIFEVTWLDELWRIFVRLRVVMTEARKPKTKTELITTQKVGFSGVRS